MTPEEAKEQVARQYTGGKHGWYDDYLTPRIKLLLMEDVAKIYAESQLSKYREALDRVLQLLQACRPHTPGLGAPINIIKSVLEQEVNNG